MTRATCNGNGEINEIKRSGKMSDLLVQGSSQQTHSHTRIFLLIDIDKDLTFICRIDFQDIMKHDTPRVISEVSELWQDTISRMKFYNAKLIN